MQTCYSPLQVKWLRMFALKFTTFCKILSYWQRLNFALLKISPTNEQATNKPPTVCTDFVVYHDLV